MLNRIYVSITSIKGNQKVLLQTLDSINNQSIKPDRCFLYLSEDPYLLDQGFENRQLIPELNHLVFNNSMFELKWVKNTGPYRKLLPLLKDKISEDCVIIAIDDDTVYNRDMIETYVNYYKKYNCVIAARSYTLKFDDISNISYMDRKEIDRLNLYNFHTGKGGVLYSPKFFAKSLNHFLNEEIYKDCCPFGDDIWFNLHRIANGVQCYIPEKSSYTKDNTTIFGLWNNINSKNDNNTKYIRKTVHKLKELGYLL